MAVVTKIVDPGEGAGHDYHSLSLWEAGEQGDLTTGARAGEIATALCRATNGTADTTPVLISGWTTSATGYVHIRVDDGHRHGGVWDGTKYRLIVNTAWDGFGALRLAQSYTRVDGVQVEKSDTQQTCSGVAITGQRCWISNVLVRAGSGSKKDIGLDVSSVYIKVWNCISHGFERGLYADWGSSTELYSSSLVGSVYGVLGGSNFTNTIAAKNCYASGGTSAYSGADITQTNCASSDTTASGTNPQTNVAYNTDTFVNVTAGSEDFRLALDGASPLKGVGTDTSGESAPLNFTTDIAGNTRDATWDIGAFAWVEAATSSWIPSVMQHHFIPPLVGSR